MIHTAIHNVENPERVPDPLRTYAVDMVHLDVDSELRMAREALAQADTGDIHTHHDMLRAAVDLSMRLRSLVASVEAERGEGQ